MQNSRCGNFSIEVEEIYVTGAPVVLRVPIRRCALAERMIEQISETKKGRQVARKLTIPVPDAAESPSRAAGAGQKPSIRAAFGPDLEAIHPNECTVQRCRESCTPSYRSILLQFGQRARAESEMDLGCIGSEQQT